MFKKVMRLKHKKISELKMLEPCIYMCRRDAFVGQRCRQEMLPFPLENGCNSWEEEGVLSKKIRRFKFSRLSKDFSRLEM